MRKVMMAAVTGALAVVASGVPSSASHDDTLHAAGGSVTWTGSAPLVLSDDRTFTVALPEGHWDEAGGVQVAVRWESEDDDLELTVTAPDGTQHSSTGFPSTAESVLIPAAPNGEYTVSVSSASNPDVPYEAIAQVEHDAVHPADHELLPDLISLPPRNPGFAIGAYLVDPTDGIDVTSCYPEEMAEQGARRCLRFDQVIANVGEGPFELRYSMPPDGAEPNPSSPNLVEFRELRQRIYLGDGSHRDRFADTYEFHPAHAHFHYRNFAVSSLWTTGGELVAGGRKNGFCMVDVENHWFGELGDAARTYVPPACLAPTTGDEIVNGISVGWADVYNWYLADQFIEVSGVRDGTYVLRTIADPASTVEEMDDTNNCSAALVELSGGGIEARIVGPASC